MSSTEKLNSLATPQPFLSVPCSAPSWILFLLTRVSIMQLIHANIMVSEWIHWTQQEYSCCVKLSTQTCLQGKGCIWDDRGKAKAFYRPAFNKNSSTQIGKLSLSILEIKMNPFFAIPTKLKITYIFLFKYSCHGAWSQFLMWGFFNHKYFSSLQFWNGLEQEKEMTCSSKDRSSWEEWQHALDYWQLHL